MFGLKRAERFVGRHHDDLLRRWLYWRGVHQHCAHQMRETYGVNDDIHQFRQVDLGANSGFAQVKGQQFSTTVAAARQLTPMIANSARQELAFSRGVPMLTPYPSQHASTKASRYGAFGWSQLGATSKCVVCLAQLACASIAKVCLTQAM